MWSHFLPSILLGAFLISFVTLSGGQINFGQGGGRGFGGGGFSGGRFPGQNSAQRQTPRPSIPSGSPQETKLPGCNCNSQDKCPPGFGQLGTSCVLENGGPGICCIPQEGVVLTRIGFANKDFEPMSLTDAEISQGYRIGLDFANNVKANYKTRKSQGQFLQHRSPARGHAYFFHRNPSAKRVHELAYAIAQTSVALAKSESLSLQQSAFGLPGFRIGPQMGLQCPIEQIPRCDPNSRFRTIDGTCNNLRNPLFGKSETQFSRLSEPLYNDGIMEPRINGVDGKPLPNVRDAANTVLIDIDNPDPEFTLVVMQFSQFMDHDLTLTQFPDMDGEAIMCCQNGRRVNPLPEQCWPIDVSPNDRFYGPRNEQCLNFVRNMLALRPGCAMGPVEQMNVLTHWVDGSMIYGSTAEEEFRVADPNTGFMRLSANNLPPINASIDCDARVPNTPCMAGGDTRINEQPALTVMHTIWIREHNRIAAILKRRKPNLTPRQLFEETRRIVIAEVQHIAFTEWLPIIIGPTLANGLRSGYNPSLDPAIASEFSTAAFRFGHTTIQGTFKLISEVGRVSTVRLRDTFNAPNLLPDNPKLVDMFVRALTTQSIQTYDSFISQDLTNHLFQTAAFDFGMDLMSLNLQRGRDHAISTYNQMRVRFGLPRANSFLDLVGSIPVDIVRRIQTVYRNVDDIDLWIGGITEVPQKDALLGTTFSRLIAHQFQIAKSADRFFYDLPGQPGSFTPDQLRQIKNSNLARILCDNSAVGQLQRFAFRLAHAQRNPVYPCNSPQIPSVDLSFF